MKILFLGDYSNLHSCLAQELRRAGHSVTVISDGGRYLRTDTDIILDRKDGHLGSVRYILDIARVLPHLKGFDVVQLINPHFLYLRPSRLWPIVKWLKHNNRSLFLTLAGNDYFFVRECCSPDGLFRFSEFRVGSHPTPLVLSEPGREKGWLLPEVERYTRNLYDFIDGAVAVLPEYHMAARPVLGDRLSFSNLPVNLSQTPFSGISPDFKGPIRLFVGLRRNMEVQKGTRILWDAAEQLARRYPDRFQADSVSSIPLTEYLKKLHDSHIVLDQLYSYSPATNALQTMAMGRISASGGQPEFYNYIGWNHDLRPVVCLQPDSDIKAILLSLADNPEILSKRSILGRQLVEQNNDVRTVADRFLKHWSDILQRKC